MEEVEIWKDIEGYPLYKISNLGRVKRATHEKEILHPKYGAYLAYRKEKILKLNNAKDGYSSVKIYNDIGFSNRLVHRLVAEAFIDNSESKPHC